MGAIFTRKVIADLFFLSEKRIRQLTDEGIIEEYSNGYYALVPAVKGYIRYLQRQISDDDSSSDYNTEKAKLTKTKREDAELDLMVKRGELHKASDIEFIMTNMLIALREKLLTLPNKVISQIVATPSGDEYNDAVIKILHSAVLDALNELSGYSKELFDPDKYMSKLNDPASGSVEQE